MQRLELTDSDLLRKLMRRAPGGPLSVRALASKAGISKTRVDDLLHDRYATVTEPVATRIAELLGIHRGALFMIKSSTSMDADSEGGTSEHGRALDADAHRLVQELGEHGGPPRPDGRRA